MAITAHYAVKDENGALIIRSRLVAFKVMPESHTGVNLGGAFFDVMKSLGVLYNVRSDFF